MYDHILRNFEVGQTRVGELYDVGNFDGAAGFGHDDRAHFFAHHGVRNAEHGDFEDGGMRREGAFHFHAVDVFAAAVHHILLTVDDLEEAVRVQAGEISGAEPAAGEGFGGGFGLLPVTGYDIGAADEEFADVAGNGVEFEIDDGRGEADGFGPRDGVFAGKEGRDGRGFGEAVAVGDARVGEGFEDAGDEVGRGGRAAVHDAAHACGVEIREIGLVDGEPVDGGNGGEDVDAFGLDGLEEGLDVEGRHDDRCAAGFAGGQQLAVAAGDVEERDGDQAAEISGRREADAAAGFHVGEEVLVRGHGAFGEAGGAAGVEDGGDVFGGASGVGEGRAKGERAPVLQNELAAGIVEDVVDFGLAETGVDGDGNGSGELDAEEGDAPVEAVGEADGDAVAVCDALSAEASGEAGGLVPELGVGDAVGSDFYEGFRVGLAFDGVAQHFDKVAGAVLIAGNAVGVARDEGLVEGLH